VRRLLTVATIYEGGTQSEAARVGGVCVHTVGDWVLRFNAAGPDGFVDGIPTGGIALLDDAQRRALAAIVGAGATRLLAMAESAARECGCHAAWLDTINPDALRLYQRCGYATFGTVDNFANGHAFSLMSKSL